MLIVLLLCDNSFISYAKQKYLELLFTIQTGEVGLPSPGPRHRAEHCPLRHPGLRQPALQPREGRRDPLDSLRIAGKGNTWRVIRRISGPSGYHPDLDPTSKKKPDPDLDATLVKKTTLDKYQFQIRIRPSKKNPDPDPNF